MCQGLEDNADRVFLSLCEGTRCIIFLAIERHCAESVGISLCENHSGGHQSPKRQWTPNSLLSLEVGLMKMLESVVIPLVSQGICSHPEVMESPNLRDSSSLIKTYSAVLQSIIKVLRSALGQKAEP